MGGVRRSIPSSSWQLESQCWSVASCLRLEPSPRCCTSTVGQVVARRRPKIAVSGHVAVRPYTIGYLTGYVLSIMSRESQRNIACCSGTTSKRLKDVLRCRRKPPACGQRPCIAMLQCGRNGYRDEICVKSMSTGKVSLDTGACTDT